MFILGFLGVLVLACALVIAALIALERRDGSSRQHRRELRRLRRSFAGAPTLEQMRSRT